MRRTAAAPPRESRPSGTCCRTTASGRTAAGRGAAAVGARRGGGEGGGFEGDGESCQWFHSLLLGCPSNFFENGQKKINHVGVTIDRDLETSIFSLASRSLGLSFSLFRIVDEQSLPDRRAQNEHRTQQQPRRRCCSSLAAPPRRRRRRSRLKRPRPRQQLLSSLHVPPPRPRPGRRLRRRRSISRHGQGC